MPSKLPRVNVVVSAEQHELLMEVARLQHRSASSLLRELLDASEPFLRAILPALRARAEALDRQPAAIQEAAQGLLQALLGDDPAQLDLVQHIEALLSQEAPAGVSASPEGHADAGSESAQRSAAACPSGAATPPSCNYGGQVR